ncbi:hypothetical protein Bca52824_048966 [Brassica carinata]|uniref:Uncharacterized protein n=1 Tax=Brassica carinata TaxID=52824 RepID=A0A8X7RK27_BRACI|nr:hypothetical protein Bca52824_048966 [Brassica carinata]
MPSGAKKRKALKKKKQLEAFGACPSNKGINDHAAGLQAVHHAVWCEEEALKKKKQLEAFGACPSNKGINDHGQEENGVDKSKQVEISDSVQHKSDESEEKHRPEEAKEGSIPVSEVPETSTDVKSVKESEVPECSQEKSLLLSGPPVVRTSWLSCCGLFDVMAGSGR